MDCGQCEILIEKQLRERLTEGDRARMDLHLSRCPGCRESMAELQALEVLLEGLSEVKEVPPVFLAQRIQANLPSRQSWGWSWPALRPLVAALSLVLALTAGYLGRGLYFPPEAAAPSLQSVRIIFFSPEASSVALVGDFNEWGKREVTMARSSDQGIWEFSLQLEPGVYHYNLLVDGRTWASNPKSSTLVPDGFGGYNSVLVVSEKCQNDCT